MAITDYFTCNCCLFAQDLSADHLKDAQLFIPENEKDNYIDCHLDLHQVLKVNEREFNLKARQSVGCRGWICGGCGIPGGTWAGHEKCWDR